MNKHLNTKNTNNEVSHQVDWKTIQIEMKNKLGPDVYESWLKKINFVDQFNNYVLLSVPTRFIRDWITSRYLDQILQIIKSQNKEISRIEFKIEEFINNNNTNDNFKSTNNDENISFIKDSFLQYNRVDPNKRFNNFIIGTSNKLAYEASLKVSESTAHYNPLSVFGGVGM